MDSFEIFSEDKLPHKCEFFSSLKDKYINEKDYSRSNSVWNAFKKNAMGDYHDLYLKTDVVLLEDVIEKFIKTYLDYYGLDPCYYFSAYGLSWDAMLKKTKVRLELVSDIDMNLFIEKGVRGAILYICKRKQIETHRNTDSKQIKYHDKLQKNIFRMHRDTNNLYDWAMIKNLPWG